MSILTILLGQLHELLSLLILEKGHKSFLARFFYRKVELALAMDPGIWEAFHLCDSLFPGGTLAQSQGLESALLNSYIKTKDISQFVEFCTMVLEQVVTYRFAFRHS